MTRVYKYPFQIADVQTLRLPRGGKVRLVGPQNETPCMWIENDPDAPLVPRVVRVYGTGHDIDEPGLEHVGSFQDGQFVWHVYLEPRN